VLLSDGWRSSGEVDQLGVLLRSTMGTEPSSSTKLGTEDGLRVCESSECRMLQDHLRSRSVEYSISVAEEKENNLQPEPVPIGGRTRSPARDGLWLQVAVKFYSSV